METEQITNFKKRIEEQEDENLILIFRNKADYQVQYISLVEQELEKRGYVLSELEVPNEEKEIIENMSDEDLVDILIHPKNYDKETIKLVIAEATKRDLAMEEYFNAEELSEDIAKEILKNGLESVFKAIVGI